MTSESNAFSLYPVEQTGALPLLRFRQVGTRIRLSGEVLFLTPLSISSSYSSCSGRRGG